jgi:hypothetical protein
MSRLTAQSGLTTKKSLLHFAVFVALDHIAYFNIIKVFRRFNLKAEQQVIAIIGVSCIHIVLCQETMREKS